MAYQPPERHDALKVTVDKVVVSFTSNPFVVYTFRGYAPVVNVRTESGENRTLYISSKSISDQLHNVVLKNNDEWSGLTVRIWKESADRFAKYMVEELDADGQPIDGGEEGEEGEAAADPDKPPEDAAKADATEPADKPAEG